MISRLRGSVIEREESRVVLDVHGVGYEVAVTSATGRSLPPDDEPAELYIRLINREGEWDLYGFLEPFERSLFDLLLTVTGVGPRSAMSLLDRVGPASLAGRIAEKDAKALTAAAGVGQKLAQRIVLEIADKAAELALTHRAVVRTDARAAPLEDVEAALLALGYTKQEARRAAQAATEGEPGAPIEDLVRRALARIGRD